MPELPDLVHIRNVLASSHTGAVVSGVALKNPIVYRALEGDRIEVLVGQRINGIVQRGPFLNLQLSEHHLVIHPMLAGRFLIEPKRKKTGLCFSMETDRGPIYYLDTKKMGKVYLGRPDSLKKIPRYETQGIAILSKDFTGEYFKSAIKKRRQQVRVFLMDQENISAIGNAYADEILFEAKIHPKAICASLKDAEIDRLHSAIVTVIDRGIKAVRAANAPLDEKVRDHMQVRNKRDEPCPVCGERIRRVAVLGHDAFFCPDCHLRSTIRTRGKGQRALPRRFARGPFCLAR